MEIYLRAQTIFFKSAKTVHTYLIFSTTVFGNIFSSADILDPWELILRKCEKSPISENHRFRKISVWRLSGDARADCPSPSAQRKLFLARKIHFYPWESVVKPPLHQIERFVTMKFNDDVSMKIYKNQELFFEQFLIPRSCGSPGAKNGPCYRYYQSRRARTHRAATIGSRSWSRSTDNAYNRKSDFSNPVWSKFEEFPLSIRRVFVHVRWP